MKKTVEVKVPARVTKASTKKVVKTFCDVEGCSKSAERGSYSGGGSACRVCNRDVCYDHKRGESDGGDYMYWYCSICFDTYIPAMRELEDEHEKEEDTLKLIIKKQSLSQTLKG